MAAQQWANILFNTNFSVNFLLYCVSGRNFRKSLRNLCFWGSRESRRGRIVSKPSSKCPGRLTFKGSKSRRRGKERQSRNNSLRGFDDSIYRHTSTRHNHVTKTDGGPSTSHNREMSFYPTSVTEVETYA